MLMKFMGYVFFALFVIPGALLVAEDETRVLGFSFIVAGLVFLFLLEFIGSLGRAIAAGILLYVESETRRRERAS